LFEIVAHRGCPDTAPENTLLAFLRAVELGADSVELDVRLTADGVLVVYHYFYLDKITNLSGPIFSHTWDEVRRARFSQATADGDVRIPLLDQVLDALAGRIGLEIEIKGPESESVDVLAAVLKNHPGARQIEVTSYEPMLLRAFQRRMPGIPTDLLIPRSEAWMGRDVVAYAALQRGRMAGARAVHLHPSQIDRETVDLIHQAGLEVHAWDVNDLAALQRVTELQIPRLDTDQLQQAITYREGKQYDRPI
jgi:glycerophosphoryl diester phosphodiesterase